jgi:hypothetical protein
LKQRVPGRLSAIRLHLYRVATQGCKFRGALPWECEEGDCRDPGVALQRTYVRTLRIFVSSPGDVTEERALAARVLRRLELEVAGRVTLEPIFWEHEPLLASKSFQAQIVRPSGTEIVVCILWARLGTRLQADFCPPGREVLPVGYGV